MIITVSLFISLLGVGCSDSDEPLQGWKESDVEVVNEGTAPGTTRQVVAPGESTPMTGTNFDTTTDLDMITDEQLGLGVTDPDGDERRPGSLADQLDLDDGTEIRPSAAERRPTSTSTRPAPTPTPSPTRPAPATQTRSPQPEPAEQQPRPAPRPEPEPEPEPEPAEPADPSREEDGLPPIIVPTPEPDPPSPDETDPDSDAAVQR